MPNIFYASVEVTDVHFSMKINGVELAKLKDKQKYLVELPITSWVQNGVNQLLVEVFSLPEEENIRGEVSIDVYLHDAASEYPKAKETYVSYRYPNPDSEKDDNKSFQTQIVNFDVPQATPTKLWLEASTITSLSDKDKTDIVDMINRLGAGIVDGKSNEITDALEYKIQEESRMHGVDFAQSLSVAKNSFDMLRKHGTLEQKTFDINDASFNIVGNNKVIYVSTKTNSAALSLSLGDHLIEIPIYVSKLNSHWRIVR